MAGEKVLIVDDEVDVLELCRRILEAKGYRVTTASNGYEAINLAKLQDFDLLLTDNQMPGITGLEIAKVLKQSDPNIICVTMTGFSTIDIVVEALKIDIDEFVMKPFTPNELSLAISKALEKQRLRRENFRLRSLVPLFEFNKRLMTTRNVPKLLNHVHEIAKHETKADLVWVYTYEGDDIVYHPHPEETTDFSDIQQTTSYKLAQQLQHRDQHIFINQKNANDDEANLLKDLNGQSVIATPIRSQDNLGALILLRRENEFAPSDGEFLSVMCGQASIALDNAKLFTEKQEAYEELKKLDHMKSEFINIAAHELRTPLTILIGYTTILEDIADEMQREFIAPIMRNAMRLRSLIDDMLNLQYLESGVPKLKQDNINLPQAVEAVTKDIGLFIKEKNISLTVTIPSDFPIIIGDTQKLDLIMVNLLDNAVKFNHDGGLIAITASYDNDKVTLAVKDTGKGIPQEKLNRIFDRFFQIEPSLTREHGGIGLGLAIVRGMVEVCGGKISVKSKEGEGSTFAFTLPRDNSNIEATKLII